jgi:hypothetical protein
VRLPRSRRSPSSRICSAAAAAPSTSPEASLPQRSREQRGERPHVARRGVQAPPRERARQLVLAARRRQPDGRDGRERSVLVAAIVFGFAESSWRTRSSASRASATTARAAELVVAAQGDEQLGVGAPTPQWR